jgi:putative membrane protein
MFERLVVVFHLLGMATFLGAAVVQQAIMKRSARPDLAPAVRDDLERLAATVARKIEAPALLIQMALGVYLLVTNMAYMKMPWMHVKLTLVVLIFGLSHACSANARKIVKARAERGDGAADEIVARKARHGTLGAIVVTLAIVVVALAELKPGS